MILNAIDSSIQESVPDVPNNVNRRRFIVGTLAASMLVACGKWSESEKSKVNDIFECDISRSVKVSELSSEKFEEAIELLQSVKIDPTKEIAVAFLRWKDRRVFALKLSLDGVQKASPTGWIVSIWKSKIWIPSDKDFSGIRWRYKDYIFGALAMKDENGITLFDESDAIFGPCKSNVSETWDQKKDDEIPATEKATVGRTPQKITGKFRTKPISLWYHNKHPEITLRIDKTLFPEKDKMLWRILRSYRWKRITDAVEKRYKIPKGLLLAMMAQEGYGDPTLPNFGWDGGLWLIHIQWANAQEFWLKTLPIYTHKMRDVRHGDEIKKALAANNWDLKKLVSVDDRFHPIMAVDVSARFLMEHYSRVKRVNPKMLDDEIWNLALKRYAGRPHAQYGSKVREYQAKINDSKYIWSIESQFSGFGVAHNNKILSFHEYMGHYHKILENYEIERYERMWTFKI